MPAMAITRGPASRGLFNSITAGIKENIDTKKTGKTTLIDKVATASRDSIDIRPTA